MWEYEKWGHLKSGLPIHVKLMDIDNKKNSNKKYWRLYVNLDEESNREQYLQENNSKLAPYNDNEGDTIDCCDIEDNYEINITKSGKYMTSFYIPIVLHSAIIGLKGSKLKGIQENTGATIKVPKLNEQSGTIKITGPTERSVASARSQVFLTALTKREKLPITHFLSIPVISDEVSKKFLIFKENILSDPSTRGIDETIFQKVEKLHLTIITLRLLDEREVTEAKDILGTIHKKFKSCNLQNPINITLKGLEIMNDDPSDVNVLYGKIDLMNEDNVILQQLIEDILKSFFKSGLMKKQFDNVKFHVTLMNSSFRKGDDYQQFDENQIRKKESFDATYILQKYRDFDFGKITLNALHLSVRYTTDKNGYYEAVIKLDI